MKDPFPLSPLRAKGGSEGPGKLIEKKKVLNEGNFLVWVVA